MDEPLSNLDAKLRVQMRADIAALQSRLGVTTVYVTHDQSEAMTLGHRVAVLEGRAAAAVRRAADAVRAAGEHLRRGLHRLAGDEPLRAAARRERLGLRSAASPSRCPPARGRLGPDRARPAAGVARARRRRACRRASRWSRRSAPTRTSSASPRSRGEEVKLVARCETRRLRPSGTRASICAAAGRGARLQPGDGREARRTMSGRGLPRRDPGATGGAAAAARARAGVRGGRGRARAARADRRAAGRPRHLGQRGVVRRLRLRPAPGLDGAARLDLADRLLRRRDRLRQLGGGRALAVGPDARTSSSTCSVRARDGALTIALTNDPRRSWGRRPSSCCRSRPGRSRRSRRRRRT